MCFRNSCFAFIRVDTYFEISVFVFIRVKHVYTRTKFVLTHDTYKLRAKFSIFWNMRGYFGIMKKFNFLHVFFRVWYPTRIVKRVYSCCVMCHTDLLIVVFVFDIQDMFYNSCCVCVNSCMTRIHDTQTRIAKSTHLTSLKRVPCFYIFLNYSLFMIEIRANFK